MNKIIDQFAKYILEAMNLKEGQFLEICCPIECKELALKLVEVGSFYNCYITYDNMTDDYYIKRGSQFYKELMENDFARLVILSSFVKPKNKYFCKTFSYMFNDYFGFLNHKYTIVAYANEKWAMNLGIDYEELRDRIISFSTPINPLANSIEKLKSLNIKSCNIKTNLGTDLNMELTDGFTFNDGYVKGNDGSKYLKNIPCLEIFTSPIKNSVNGKLYASKDLYVNNHIIKGIYLEFKDGRVIDSKGITSVIFIEEGLRYLGELGISIYNDFKFYNTILDENSATHVAIGNAYELGIKEKEYDKLNYTKHHVDISIGTFDMVITFYNDLYEVVARFMNDEFVFY